MLRPIVQSRLLTCKSENHQTCVNSRRRWRAGHANGKGFTIISNSVIDYSNLSPSEFKLLTVITRFAHNQTGEVTAEIRVLARAVGWTDRWTQKINSRIIAKGFLGSTPDYDPVLKLNRPNTYRLLNPHKPVETKAQSDTTPGERKDTQSLLETPNTLQVQPPYPPQAGGCVNISQPEPEVSKPRGRHSHHHEPRRSRCTGSSLSAFQLAALEVMRLCAVSDTSWRVREGIAAAIALHVAGDELRAKRAVEPMVIAWRDYLDEMPYLFAPCKIGNFFAEAIWRDRRQWTYDREALARLRRGGL